MIEGFIVGEFGGDGGFFDAGCEEPGGDVLGSCQHPAVVVAVSVDNVDLVLLKVAERDQDDLVLGDPLPPEHLAAQDREALLVVGHDDPESTVPKDLDDLGILLELVRCAQHGHGVPRVLILLSFSRLGALYTHICCSLLSYYTFGKIIQFSIDYSIVLLKCGAGTTNTELCDPTHR